MTKTEDAQTPAVGSLLDRGVRPVAQVQRMGSFQGVPHYGCLLNLEAEHRMKVNDPLYGQAELDAAVAAERERLRVLVEAVRDANFDAEDGDTFQLLKPGQERAWLALLAGLQGSNFNSTTR